MGFRHSPLFPGTMNAKLALFALVLFATPAVGQKTWVLDQAGGPGTDFLQLPAALVSAASGDTILVRAGVYPSPLLLTGKGLTVAGVHGEYVRFGGGSIRDLPVGEEVVLIGLELASGMEAGLQIKNCDGPVLIEDCSILGANKAPYSSGQPGLQIDGAARVTISGSHLQGGRGENFNPSTWTMGTGAHGLTLRGSFDVALVATTCVGGHGGSGSDGSPASGLAAGSGIWIESFKVPIAPEVGRLSVAGSVLTGGIGGSGGWDDDPFFGYSCGSGATGGDGIEVEDQTSLLSTACPIILTSDNTIQPGAGGFSACSGAPQAPDGLPFNLHGLSSAIDDLKSYVKLAVAAPFKDTDPVTAEIRGPVGAASFLIAGQGGAHLDLAGLGTLLVDPLGALVIPTGVIGPSGKLDLNISPPVDLAPMTSLSVRLQAFVLHAGQIHIGGVRSLLIIGT